MITSLLSAALLVAAPAPVGPVASAPFGPVPPAPAGPVAPASAGARDAVVVRAGTIYAVEGGLVIEGGGAVLIQDGRIVAVGKDVDTPPGARTVDYGPDAVLAPGLVAADSTLGSSRASERTADPSLRAVDGFEPYANYVFALQEGVTSVYLAPARGRLIAGLGAVVKLAGRKDTDAYERVLNESAAIHGAVSEEARNTPGYWQPPMPATVDVGMGVEDPQLPRSLAGAIVALEELFALTQGAEDRGVYGPGTVARLRELIGEKRPWRMAAHTEPEARALLAFFQEKGLPLVVDGLSGLGSNADVAGLATEMARANVAAIVEASIQPNAPGRDFGKRRDSRWPRYDVAADLQRAGVRFAITPANQVSASELRFAAGIASRGGLDREAALRAITLSPAEILGVAARVGSLAPGKDGDLTVYTAHPLDAGASVLATWVDGEVVYQRERSAAVVLAVDELYLGDGEVMSPGEVLLEGGRIRAVGHRVGRPAGAEVVRGKAAIPGMIDALGHLGLEGSDRVPATRFALGRLVEPGDVADRRVARAGVTTVVLSPRGSSRAGAPMLAYKPAGSDVETMFGEDPTALRFQWTDKNRLESGKVVREVLQKAVEYSKKWDEYEKKMATWTPPKEGAATHGDEKKDAKEGSEEKAGDAKDGEEKKGDAEKQPDKKEEKKDDAKKEEKKDDAKKKGKKGEKEAAKPITGAWETQVVIPPFEKTRLRLYVLDEDGRISGSLRCSALSDDLIAITGERKEKQVTLSGEGGRGNVSIEAEEKDGKLDGKLQHGETSVELSLEHTSTEYEVVKRSERRKSKSKDEGKKEPKGQPRSPGVDPELEPLRRAMHGDGAVVVAVDREDEILECVAAFEAANIRPILLGAKDAWKVAAEIRERVAGVLLGQQIVWTEPKTGAQVRNRYAELAEAGIRVAFHSDAEEGAAELPGMAAYAVAHGMSPDAALRALTSDVADMYAIDEHVGRIAPGLDADVALLDGSPFDISTRVLRVWVAGEEVR